MVDLFWVFLALSLGGILGYFVGAMCSVGSYFEEDEDAKDRK
jgi:hypothetical protein